MKKRKVSENQVDEALIGMYDVNDLYDAQESLKLVNSYYDNLLDLASDINSNKDIGYIIKFIENKDLMEPLFEKIYLDTRVSRKIETRGIWHRPNETSLEAIRQTLDTLQSMYFTDIYLETFWNGYVIYKSEYAPYHTLFDQANFGPYEDYLTAFINEAET